jgi:hypothetical protein
MSSASVTTIKKFVASAAKGKKNHQVCIGNPAFQSRATVLGAVTFFNSIVGIPQTIGTRWHPVWHPIAPIG